MPMWNFCRYRLYAKRYSPTNKVNKKYMSAFFLSTGRIVSLNLLKLLLWKQVTLRQLTTDFGLRRSTHARKLHTRGQQTIFLITSAIFLPFTSNNNQNVENSIPLHLICILLIWRQKPRKLTTPTFWALDVFLQCICQTFALLSLFIAFESLFPNMFKVLLQDRFYLPKRKKFPKFSIKS